MNSTSTTHPGFDAAALARIAPSLNEVVTAGDLSGAVTLVWRAGALARVDCVGMRDIAAAAPMQRDTLFRIASMTKPITSTAALMLIEAGKLRLDDPISRWLPEFADMRVLREPAGALDDTVPAQRALTVNDLLTHRAGLAYTFTSMGPIAKAYEQALPPGLTPDNWLKALGALPLSFQPGERFHYSHATDVLGFLVGRVAGTSLRDFLRERIFTPLGMSDTDFYAPAAKQARTAKVYRQDADSGALQEVPFPQTDAAPVFSSGGGGLLSTVDDYLQFARLLLQGGELNGTRLLRADSVNLMCTNQLTEAQRQITFMGLPFWGGQGFGLGVSVITDPAKQAWMGAGNAGAFGWPGAFGTWWQADPAQQLIAIFMIANSTPLAPDMASQLATGQRMGARAALPTFQQLVYGALRG